MSEKKLRLYYTWRDSDKGDSLIEDDLCEHWLSELSPEKKAAISRLLHKTDQHSSLLGLQLVKYCAHDLQVADFSLSDIEYPVAGKPFWRGANLSVTEDTKAQANEPSSAANFDFNISHSNALVMVIASTGMRVGVDVEKIRQLKSLNFKSVMLEHELALIKNQPEHFFRLWSIKEAVVKAANTAGLSRMLEVKIDAGECANIASGAGSFAAEFESRRWQVKQWRFDKASKDKKFSVAVAASQTLGILEPTFVSIDMMR